MDISSIIARIEAGDNILIVYYDKTHDGLWNTFSSDDEVKNFIIDNLDIAFEKAIQKTKGTPYMLNIASVNNYGSWGGNIPQKLLERQFAVYVPLIQKFIVTSR